MIEQALGLRKVNDVDPNCSLHRVPHSKHEPLKRIGAIRVIADPNIKDFQLSLTHLFHVGALKRTIKFDEFLSADFDIFTLKHKLLILRNTAGCGRLRQDSLLR